MSPEAETIRYVGNLDLNGPVLLRLLHFSWSTIWLCGSMGSRDDLF
jgi:hypothetical protein